MSKRVEDIDLKKGSRILVRTSLNVPIKNGVVIDDSRLEKAAETISFLKNKGYKVIVISHLGRKGESLEIVSKKFQEFVPHKFVNKLPSNEVIDIIHSMEDGDAILLENLRIDPRETNKSIEFAKEIARLGDAVVFDAFADSHRDHSSISLLPTLLPCYLGILMEREVETLKLSLSPQNPSLCVIGGAKLETKLSLLQVLTGKYDKVFIGGVLANTLLKHKGFEVGTSVVEDIPKNLSLNFERITLPDYVVVKRGEDVIEVSVRDILKEDKIMDVGLKSIDGLKEYITLSKIILWNGPLGFYEEGFIDSSFLLAKYMAFSSAYSIIGGGDTIGSLKGSKIQDKISFVSTGGGATLDFLANEGGFKGLNC